MSYPSFRARSTEEDLACSSTWLKFFGRRQAPSATHSVETFPYERNEGRDPRLRVGRPRGYGVCRQKITGHPFAAAQWGAYSRARTRGPN